jgi:hypothetical protein
MTHVASKDEELVEIWRRLSDDEKVALIAKAGPCLDGVDVPEDDEEAAALLLRTVRGDA